MSLAEYSKEWIIITSLIMAIVVTIIIVYTCYIYYIKDYSKRGNKND